MNTIRVAALVPALLALAGCGGGGGGGGPEPAVVITACDPTAQTGCSPGKKCTWLRVSSGGSPTGTLACTPAGAVDEGATCRFGADGATTGYDDCKAGLVCEASTTTSGASGTCSTICDPSSATSCTPSDTLACVAFSGYFASGAAAPTAGMCQAQCDPLTQVRLTDGAPACGSLDPLHPSRGCYGAPSQGALPTVFTCAVAGPSGNVSDVAVGTSPALNACAPGFLPLLVEASGSSVIICTALCEPTDTTLASHADPGGLSPHSCADAGAGGTHECRYLWFLEGDTTPTGRWSNGLGVCFDYAQYVTDPSCTTLTTTDNTYSVDLNDAAFWGCVSKP